MPKRILMQCRTKVNSDSIRRETLDGVEHIIVSSATLPDDIVMNGGLYPADEIAISFETLEGTLAPVEHPEIDGKFLSANDARAIHGFHAGAFNKNVKHEGGRVHIDKFINVQEALKTERGKRLLDRVNELETNDNPRPIHTSIGVFLDVEELDEPKTNAEGQKYTWIARDMVFDHDAILLDSVGAAQPHQGVGMAVNQAGDEFEVSQFELDANQDQSVSDLHQAVTDALERSAFSISFIEELFPDHVIFQSGDNLFDVPFVVDEQGIATVVGIPLPVERNVTFTPKTNRQKGDKMKEIIINALKAAGIKTEGLSDVELMDAHAKINVNEEKLPAEDDVATVVANAVAEAIKPLGAQVEALQASQAASGIAEITSLAEIVANSGKYPGMDVDSAKLLPVDKLKELAANCSPSFGLSPVINSGGQDDQFAAPADMPA